MSSTITATVSGNVVNASVASAGVSASVGSPQAVVQASGPQIAPVQSVNGQVGNVVLPTVAAMPTKPEGMVSATTVMPAGTFSLSVRSTTGYFAVLWWDGSVQVFGAGLASQYSLGSKAVPASSGSSPKSIVAWPCQSLTSAALSGSITGFSCTSKYLTSLVADSCLSLAELSCDTNQITTLRVASCPLLTSLSCHMNRLSDLDVSDCPLLSSLSCQANLLSGLDLSRNTAMQSLSCGENLLTSLNLWSLPALVGLYCHNNLLTSLDLRANLLLKNLNASANRLTSVRATGIAGSGPAGINVASNLLESPALNTLYSDLAPVALGSVYVAGNPGTAGDSPTIATAKGYAVYG